ncbi:hypothetical protein NDU88_001638 [Pleurodeles waltl]|uniref:Uncharacterized protein n=1 Tax=Pleurodeles waltl TaxID=8319 RepID=A0AAV7U902_PLEWA|nr:hypothetical protein NDU88_001638 [Pleurodeles waltl]
MTGPEASDYAFPSLLFIVPKHTWVSRGRRRCALVRGLLSPISSSPCIDPEENFLAGNEDARLDEGGVCKPIASSSELETDSSDTADRETAAIGTEHQREGHAGSRTPEETTTRRLPDAQWDKQEEANYTDRPRSRRSVA